MVTPQSRGPDVFEERYVERPEAGPGEVLVRVVASLRAGGTGPYSSLSRMTRLRSRACWTCVLRRGSLLFRRQPPVPLQKL